LIGRPRRRTRTGRTSSASTIDWTSKRREIVSGAGRTGSTTRCGTQWACAIRWVERARWSGVAAAVWTAWRTRTARRHLGSETSKGVGRQWELIRGVGGPRLAEAASGRAVH